MLKNSTPISAHYRSLLPCQSSTIQPSHHLSNPAAVQSEDNQSSRSRKSHHPLVGNTKRNERVTSNFWSAMNKFKAMDKANNPQGVKPNFATGGHRSGPASPKETMLNWCRAVTRGYQGVEINNFGSSWSDGLAFCAMIHHFYPDSFDFSELKPENRRHNFELAFEKAEKLGNVAPLLDVEDLMRMKVPDWKCVFTQIQLYYRRFHLEEGKNAHVPPVGIIPKAAPPAAKSDE